MECQEIDGNVHITGNQIQQTQSDISLSQAPVTPKCRRRCNRTLPSDQAEQELEVTVKNSAELVQQILLVPRNHGVVTVFRDSKILTTWAYAMLKTNLVYDT
ncbi:hypothetical protein MRX96_009117 [Rhipicephalus microplus]